MTVFSGKEPEDMNSAHSHSGTAPVPKDVRKTIALGVCPFPKLWCACLRWSAIPASQLVANVGGFLFHDGDEVEHPVRQHRV